MEKDKTLNKIVVIADQDETSKQSEFDQSEETFEKMFVTENVEDPSLIKKDDNASKHSQANSMSKF